MKRDILAGTALIMLLFSVANSNAQSTNSVALPKAVLERRSQFDPKSKTARDPFFPESTRSGAKPSPATNAVVAAPVIRMGNPEDLLVLKGISGSADRRFALINSQILSAGEEAYVRTDAGLAKVKCLQISDNAVVLEVGDKQERKELRLRGAR